MSEFQDGAPNVRVAARLPRQELVRRFEGWLDELEADGGPPDGVAAEILDQVEGLEDLEAPDRRCDLLSLWSAMTTLAQEVKLQGRAFKDLDGTLTPLREGLGAQSEMLANVARDAREACNGAGEQQRAAVREARSQAQREMLELVLDVRERLARAVRGARVLIERGRDAEEPGWLGRLLGLGGASGRQALEAVAALEEGSRLGLDRIDEALSRLGVRELECFGQKFDPATMNAADRVPTDDVAEDGMVLEVLRPGYERNGEVLRLAQVTVARTRQEVRK